MVRPLKLRAHRTDLSWGGAVLEPATLNCPNCGAAASPDSTRCAYCLSTLAVLVCAKCFGAIFSGMKHCPWCGEEGGAARPKADGGLKCPRCAKPLAHIQLNEHGLAECLRCGGLWVDSETLQKVCATAEDQEAVLAMDRSALPVAPEGAKPGRTYVPCPMCAKLMNRTNFAGCSGVVVDWCKPHGSWFDKDELRRIVEFVRNGGLRKAREREKERLKQESDRLKEQQRQVARLGSVDIAAARQANSGMDTFFEAVTRMLADR